MAANNCDGPTNFTLSCSTDGPKQVVNVTSHMTSTAPIYKYFQNCDVKIICTSGYERKVCT